MKVTINQVQSEVYKYREQIVQAGIPIEPIIVYYNQSPGALERMSTRPGKIYVNNGRDFSVGSLGQVVLHELGHRAIEVINPDIEEKLIKFLMEYGTRFMKQEDDINESLAEVFANHIFPNFCSLDEEVLDYIAEEDERTRSLYVSYEHFVRELQEKGFEQFKGLLRGMPVSDSRSATFMLYLLNKLK